MSLAHKTSPLDSLAQFGQVSGEMNNILRLALNSVARKSATPMASPSRHGHPFDRSMNLIDQVAGNMEALQRRCDQIERDRAQDAEQSRSEIDAAQQQAREWERRANTVRAQLCECEARLSDLQLRLDATVHRAEHAETRLAAAEQQAVDATDQAQRFHEKIMTVFGSDD